jgi:hypothetical protein
MVQIRHPTIDRARAHVDDEINLLSVEREAFKTFLNRLNKIQTNGQGTTQTDGASTALTALDSSAPTTLQPIRQAYRETVMQVPHYDQEYGDTLQESLTAELGETVATYVMNGQILSPMVHDTLRQATEQCVDEREGFLRLLREESESLDTIATELNDLEECIMELNGRIDAANTSAQLARIDKRLQYTEERCSDLATRRQERIHNRANIQFSGIDSTSLSQYLYTGMETVTPALTDITSCLDTIRDVRTRCLH